MRRTQAAGIILIAALAACGDLTVADGSASTGSMFGSITGTSNGDWDAGVSAYALFEGDSALRIVGEDTLHRSITMRLMGVNAHNVSTARRSFSLTLSTLFDEGFGQVVEVTTSGALIYSTDRLGGYGSVTLTSLSATRVTGTFNFAAVSIYTDASGQPVKRYARGEFDLGIRQ